MFFWVKLKFSESPCIVKVKMYFLQILRQHFTGFVVLLRNARGLRSIFGLAWVLFTVSNTYVYIGICHALWRHILRQINLLESKKEGKDQESIQSCTTSDPDTNGKVTTSQLDITNENNAYTVISNTVFILDKKCLKTIYVLVFR